MRGEEDLCNWAFDEMKLYSNWGSWLLVFMCRDMLQRARLKYFMPKTVHLAS